MLDARRRPDNLPVKLERDDRLLDIMTAGPLLRRLHAHTEYLARGDDAARTAAADGALDLSELTLTDLPASDLDACLGLLADRELPGPAERTLGEHFRQHAHELSATRCQQIADELGLAPPADGPVWVRNEHNYRTSEHALTPDRRILCGRSPQAFDRRETSRERGPLKPCKRCLAAIAKSEAHLRHPQQTHSEWELARHAPSLQTLTMGEPPRTMTDLLAAVDAYAWSGVYWGTLSGRLDRDDADLDELSRVTGVRIQADRRWRQIQWAVQASGAIQGLTFATAAERVAAWRNEIALARDASDPRS